MQLQLQSHQKQQAAIPVPTKLIVVILPAVPTVEPSSLIVKASTRTVEIPVLDAASTPINGPTKSSPMAPVAFVPLPSDTATPALIVIVAIPGGKQRHQQQLHFPQS